MQKVIEVIKNINFCGLCTTGKCEECDRKKAKDEVINSLEEIQQYRAIGTPEECREAVEKQKAKRCNLIGDGYADGKMVYDTYECPNCGKQYEVEYDEFNYCPECGQKLEEIIYEL